MIPYAQNAKQQEEEEIPSELEYSKDIAWYHKLLLNRSLKVIITLLLMSILAPILIYHYLFSIVDLPPSDGYSLGSCLLPRTARLPCGVGTVSSTECHPECCYDFSNSMCFHRFPSRFSYLMYQEWSQDVFLQPRIATVPYISQRSLANIKLSIDEISKTHLSLTFYNPQAMSSEGRRLLEKDYVYEVSSPELNVVINGSNGNIFNTIRGPVIASENIWELAFKLTEETMFGLGELPLKEDTVKVIYSHNGGLSSIPLIFAKLNGTYHGLLIDIQEPTEVKILGDNQVLIRSITKNGLKFHVFVGPQPKDIMRDVRAHIGFNMKLEYWMLGAHVCSDPNQDADFYHDLSDLLTESARENIPFESHCVKPIVFADDPCLMEELYELAKNGSQLLRRFNKRFTPHLSPYIRYVSQNDTNSTNDTIPYTGECPKLSNVFSEMMLRNTESQDIYKGTVDEYEVIYPDYSLERSTELLEKLWPKWIEADAIIQANSWPLDASVKHHNNTYDVLPYFNENFEAVFNNTPQWDVKHPSDEQHIYHHNAYGNNFAKAFGYTKNITIWSSSQWMNGGVIINRQNINASWDNLQKELIEAALGGISGHWLWTSPICGDTEHFDPNNQVNLCVKWYMAGTYFPLIRIHSKSIARYPSSFEGVNRNYIKTALKTRLSLLPYFYTTLQEGPLLRPMFYQFPSSEHLTLLTSQFSVGDDLLIVPNLQPSQSHVHVRLPPGKWYELWSGVPLNGEEGEIVTMTTTESDFLVLVRGSSVIITHKEVADSAEETRLHSKILITVALECSSDTTNQLLQDVTKCEARGTLYISPNLTLLFEANDATLTISAEGNDFSSLCDERQAVWARGVEEINIYGLADEKNNYDHHRNILTSINLCELRQSSYLVVDFV